MTNGGYPDEETALAVDDEDDGEDEQDDSVGTADAGSDESETQDDPSPHTDGGKSQQADDESGSTDTDETADSDSGNVGLIRDGLTKHELIAFVGCFAASYALAAIFYWGIITSGGISDVPLQMWILLGVVVLSPLALMFGLKETSTIADTLLNRGSR